MEQNIDCLVEAIVLSIKFERCLDNNLYFQYLYKMFYLFEGSMQFNMFVIQNILLKHISKRSLML